MTKYKYIINGKLEEKNEKIYYFAWTRGGGIGLFGFHGTEEEFKAKKLLEDKQNNWNLQIKREVYYENCLEGKVVKEMVEKDRYKDAEENTSIIFTDGSRIVIPPKAFWYIGNNVCIN